MRPLQRPDYTGKPIKKYKDYLEALQTAFGQYCAYCERLDKLDVEHVVPQSKAPELRLTWSNLLLACSRCNRDFKRSQNDSRDGYIWPDIDNPLLYLDYLPDGRVRVQATLKVAEKQKAENTIALLCLDDKAQKQIVLNRARRNTFRVAQQAKENYLKRYSSIDEVLAQAALGHWSVWFRVFEDVPEVVEALWNCSDFPNTGFRLIREKTNVD